jgi:hypothetical protein
MKWHFRTNSSLVFPSKDTPKRPPYLALQWHWEANASISNTPIHVIQTQYCRIWSVVNDNTIRRTFSLPQSSHHVALLGLDLGDCKIAVIVSLFIKLISCWNTPQNAGNSQSELQEIQRLSLNPSYGPDLLPYYVYLLVKTCIYMLVSPAKYAPPPSYTSLKEALPVDHTVSQ